MKKIIFSLSLSLLFTGCSSVPSLEDEAKLVRIGKQPATYNCMEVVDVYGKAKSEDQIEAMKGAKNMLRNNAAENKANYIFLETDNVTYIGKEFEILLSGKAYQCQNYMGPVQYAAPQQQMMMGQYPYPQQVR